MPLRPAPLTRNSHLPGPTLCPHLFPSMSTISAIILHPPHPYGPGRAGSPIWALRLSHTPRGWASWGSSFVAFYEESRTPPRSPPHLPRAPILSPPPTGPRDHSGWTNPGPGRLGLSSFPHLGRGDRGFPSPHLWLFPHPFDYPRKNKTAELHRSQLSPEETTSVGAWVRWGGWGRGREGARNLSVLFVGDLSGKD